MSDESRVTRGKIGFSMILDDLNKKNQKMLSVNCSSLERWVGKGERNSWFQYEKHQAKE